ncbi:MAG: MBL fold metallo-hydrolase [Actinobacteria bacterium]|nr:MAG: MBL fold metallo-hydrolase [Actinomycetota bacterium]
MRMAVRWTPTRLPGSPTRIVTPAGGRARMTRCITEACRSPLPRHPEQRRSRPTAGIECRMSRERSRLHLTVLGKSPSWQDVGGACSGYLVQEGDFALLLDCGNGVFSKLRRFCDYVDVDAVLVSHLHADHFLDLVPFSYALTYAPRQQPVPVAGWPGTEAPARPQLWAPVGAQDTLRQIVGCWGNEDLVEKAFELHEYDAPDELEVGPFRIRFCEVPHYMTTYAVDLSANGSRLTYSSDCAPNDDLVSFARGTDMLLIEATLPRPERTGVRGHLTPEEAGEHGRRALARRLVLTHYSDELDADWARVQAGQAYGGDVELAREGAVYDL